MDWIAVSTLVAAVATLGVTARIAHQQRMQGRLIARELEVHERAGRNAAVQLRGLIDNAKTLLDPAAPWRTAEQHQCRQLAKLIQAHAGSLPNTDVLAREVVQAIRRAANEPSKPEAREDAVRLVEELSDRIDRLI